MQGRDSFLLEATRNLFSSLQPETSLRSFFRFVQKRVPLREFNLNKTYMPFARTLRIVWVDSEGVHTAWEIIPISEDQRRAGRQVMDTEPELSINQRMVESEDDPLYRYLRQTPDNRLRPPFFFMRLVRDGAVIGSSAFQCTRPLSDDERDLLKGLEAPLCIALNNLLQFHELADLKDELVRENEKLRKRLDALLEEDIIGQKGGLASVMKKVRMAAPVDVPVLLTGECGTGKELIARAIHDMSSRHEGPFIPVNCETVPPALLDSELFGHTQGAFSGAITARQGRFERADGGTLFLDEVGDLPPDTQTRVLRVLETREVEKLGGSVPVKIDIRIIASTHRNLQRMVREGTFREDLFYRLKVVHIAVPPLRERRQDIPDLVQALLRRSSARLGTTMPHVGKAEMEALLKYSWPGNVRELQHVLEEALVTANGRSLHVNLAEGQQASVPAQPASLPDMDTAMREYLILCLRATRGRVEGKKGAAQIAGLTPSTFRFRCKKVGLTPRDFA